MSAYIYYVKSGDTLGRIARDNCVTVDSILAANPSITNRDRIDVGQPLALFNACEGGSSNPSDNINAGDCGQGWYYDYVYAGCLPLPNSGYTPVPFAQDKAKEKELGLLDKIAKQTGLKKDVIIAGAFILGAVVLASSKRK